jgi:murein DD-endopeptidase MepM/ murein hydrolase activator NlpD
VPEGLRSLKETEKRWYGRLVQGLTSGVDVVRVAIRRFFAWGRTRFVLAVIPQSEKPARRFEISRFSLIAIGIAVVLFVSLAVFSLSAYGATALRAASLDNQLTKAHQSIDQMRESTENLLSGTAKFQEKLDQVVTIAQSKGKPDVQQDTGDILKAAGLSDLISGQLSDDPVSRDVLRLNGVAGALDKSLPALDDIANTLASQKDIMTEVPNIWPVKGNLGHITMYFGQNENPFATGQWYLHTGIDISTNRVGDPILATADGKVIDVHYDASLGNSVTIQHSHGFTTRYGHLRSFAVKKGQRVSQGDVIGSLGNTGKTTGPHLHYEVYLGTSLIDPLRFLSIRKEYHE